MERWIEAKTDEAILWIEVKRGMRAESSQDQVLGYSRELAKNHESAVSHLAVAYMTDVGADTPNMDEKPPSVAFRPWTWRELALNELPRFEGAPMVSDFERYLKEEGLAMKPLTVDGIEAMCHIDDAELALANILDEAHGRIVERLTKWPVEPQKPLPRFNRWARRWRTQTYAQHFFVGDLEDDYGACALLEWNLLERDQSPGSERSRCLPLVLLGSATRTLRGRSLSSFERRTSN